MRVYSISYKCLHTWQPNFIKSFRQPAYSFTTRSILLFKTILTNIWIQTISQLTNLTTLSLARNKFSSLPVEVFTVASLLNLDLSENELESIFDVHVPEYTRYDNIFVDGTSKLYILVQDWQIWNCSITKYQEYPVNSWKSSLLLCH